MRGTDGLSEAARGQAELVRSGADGIALRVAQVGLFGVITTVPLPWGTPMNLGLFVAVLGLALVVVRRRRIGLELVGWLLLAFIAAATVSGLTGIHPWCGPADRVGSAGPDASLALWCGVRGAMDIARGAVVFVLAAALLTEQPVRRAWLLVIVVVTAGVAAAGLVEYALGHRTGGVFLRDPAIGHSNHTAAFLVIALPAAVSVALGRGPSLAPWAGRMAVATGTLALVLTQSLTAWIAAGATALGLAHVRRIRTRTVLVSGALISVPGVALAIAASAKLNVTWLEMSAGARLTWWGGALRVIGDNALFGIGPRSFIYVDRARYGFEPSFHAHNLYLNVAAEQGLIGLALFVAVLVMIVWRLRTTRSLIAGDMDRTCWYAAASALTALLVLGLATTPYHSRIAIMFWAIIGLFYAQFADRVPGRAGAQARPAPAAPSQASPSAPTSHP